jgi:hypothetical protein
LYTLNQARTLAPLALLITGTTWAAASTLTIASPIPGSLALARYVASVHRRDLFSESGLVAVVIEASLASPQTNSHLVALRKARESERSEYTVLESDGDATVTQEVIAPYLAEDEQIENLPLSSVIITRRVTLVVRGQPFFAQSRIEEWPSRRLGQPPLGYLKHSLVAPIGRFLAGQAEGRPGHRRQTLSADFLITVQARSKSTVLDTE